MAMRQVPFILGEFLLSKPMR